MRVIERAGARRGDGEIGELVQSLPELVREHIREAILCGAYPSGEPLRQEEIARRLGVSRVPVREALKRLESEGLVVLRPRRGYAVASLDPDEIEEIFEIRMILEERAGYLATLERAPADIAALEALLRRMDGLAADTPSNIALWAALNRAFHARLFEPSGRKHLARMAGVLRDSVERYVRVDAGMGGRLGEAQAEHRAIMEAFRAGDARRVGRLSRDHCLHTCRSLIASLRPKSR